MSGIISQRLGESWRSMLRWLPGGIVLPPLVLIPAGLLLPAWAATLVAAAIVLAMFIGSKLTESPNIMRA
jgi:hypothetical protein